MLKQRILSAVILAPLALVAILELHPQGFAILVAAIFALGCWEWARLAGFQQTGQRLGTTLVMLACMAALWEMAHLQGWMEGLLQSTALLWLALPFWFFRPNKASKHEYKRQFLKLALGIWIILGAFSAIVWLRQQGGELTGLQGSRWIFMLLFLIWAADVGAYFSGKTLGKHKLAPSISPNKTWEGLFGGLTLALCVAWLGNHWLQLVPKDALISWLLLAAATVLISVAGDLMISLLKRQEGLKDTSHIIPGHGGILDRFDSLLAASPWLAMGVQWLK